MPLSRVMTRSPSCSSSTGTSPRGVAISVPGVKQGTTFSISWNSAVPARVLSGL